MRRALLLATALALGACGKLQGLGGPVPPLVTFDVSLAGDPASFVPAGGAPVSSLRVALVWGAQWLTEPFCVLPPESPAAAAVIAAGCRDPLGFVPARVDQSVPIAPGQKASLSLFQLPSAELLVGGVTARVAYGSLVVYDDRDGDQTLGLSRPHRTPQGGDDGDRRNKNVPDSPDVVYGASFLTMTMPDQRVAYREGNVPTGAFYPRMGCDPPEPGFSILGAGGFTPAAAAVATLNGMLPAEDRAACSNFAPSDMVVTVTAQAPADVGEVGCDESTTSGASLYREPPTGAPDDLSARTTACAHLPSFDTGGSDPDAGADGGTNVASLIQLVVSGRPTDRCKGLTHYTLRGCFETIACARPDWDLTANPPSWWPCPH